ncbi:hypothetical protein Nepgr_000377 [Nepenthes gracilis]|uniref:Uncharacterized protein n=1 Tax=Nepenthes gracilis TaxID=150966 RepID=A0AAD3P557_NEPGR|nr:hypothetical protein Nepgr_000377 [Nepenthes gracilis]
MASEQQRRNTTQEREMHLEKYEVPKLTSHFEALSGKVDRESTERTDERGLEGKNAAGEIKVDVKDAIQLKDQEKPIYEEKTGGNRDDREVIFGRDNQL